MTASEFIRRSRSVAALGSVLFLCAQMAQAAPYPPKVAAPPVPATRTAIFGIMTTDAAGQPQFVPSESVPNVVGQSYGWFIRVGESSRPVKWTETLSLPAPVASWSPSGPPPPNVSVSPDGRTAVVQGEGVPEDGLIFNFWEIAPGDPAGQYTIVVKIEGGREERFSFALVASDSTGGRTPDSDDYAFHLVQRKESSSGPTTSEAMQKRIEAAAHDPVTQIAPGPRVALYEFVPPADAEEYRALAGFGVLLVTAITRDGSELPIQRVYLQGEQGAQDLRLLSSVGSTIKDPEIGNALGPHRYDAIYLFPMNLRHGPGQVLVDFATHRSNFVLGNLPLLEPDGYADSPPTAAAPPDDALNRLLRRELPGFLKSKESQ